MRRREVVFVTGNQNKAEYLGAYLGYAVEHMALDLPEIQSLDLREIVGVKLEQAFAQAQRPVLVEDVALECEALGGLPGPFIKWFLQGMSEEEICRLLDGKSRAARARCVFGYFDGEREQYFEGSMAGTIADQPAGERGFGWDRIFVPNGYDSTRAQMDEAADAKTYQQIKPLQPLKEFLIGAE